MRTPTQLAALADERQKLLRAYYANAIPLELLKADQDRITKQESAAKAELEHTEADLEGWQEVLGLAIKLAGNCHAAYLKANPKVRRRFNDAVLESVYIEDGRVARADFTEVFEALFSRPSSRLLCQAATSEELFSKSTAFRSRIIRRWTTLLRFRLRVRIASFLVWPPARASA